MDRAQHHVVFMTDGEQTKNTKSTQRDHVATKLAVGTLVGQFLCDVQLLVRVGS